MPGVKDVFTTLAALDARVGRRYEVQPEPTTHGVAVGLVFAIQAALMSAFLMVLAARHTVPLIAAVSVPVLAFVIALVLLVVTSGGPRRWSMNVMVGIGSTVLIAYSVLVPLLFTTTPFRVHVSCSAGSEKLTASFSKSFGPGRRTQAVVYDYGDGTYGDGQLDGFLRGDSHRYPRAGTYTVRLTVVDSVGTASDTCDVTVR